MDARWECGPAESIILTSLAEAGSRADGGLGARESANNLLTVAEKDVWFRRSRVLMMNMHNGAS
jgi:hypothetical protein